MDSLAPRLICFRSVPGSALACSHDSRQLATALQLAVRLHFRETPAPRRVPPLPRSFAGLHSYGAESDLTGLVGPRDGYRGLQRRLRRSI